MQLAISESLVWSVNDLYQRLQVRRAVWQRAFQRVSTVSHTRAICCGFKRAAASTAMLVRTTAPVAHASPCPAPPHPRSAPWRHLVMASTQQAAAQWRRRTSPCASGCWRLTS